MNPTLPRSLRLLALTLLTLSLVSCAHVEPASIASASDALKAGSTRSLNFSGVGRWYQFGQAPAPGLPWPAFQVSRYAADIDFEARAARVQIARTQLVEPGRERPTPVEQKVDQYIAGALAWNVPVAVALANPPATAQSAAVPERAAEIWSTPQGFLKAAAANHATTRPSNGGIEVSFRADGGPRYVGLINARSEVERVQTTIDTPVLGDTVIETVFSDYKDFAGVSFPSRIVRTQGGHPVLDLQVTEVALNSARAPAAPPAVADAATPAVTVTVTTLAPGVHYLTGGTHHSVAVEQADHLVVIEAPQNEARSLAVIAKLRELVPNKPIRYVVNTHVHFDHSGGLRTYVDAGAIIVTHEANRAYYEQAWANPRTLNPDRLSSSGKSARFETFQVKQVLASGPHRIELHEIAGNGHNDAYALVYLPAEKILIQADAYTPGAPDAPVPAVANPYTVNLYRNIQKLQLDVAQIAPLHGRVVTLADLRAAIGAGASA